MNLISSRFSRESKMEMHLTPLPRRPGFARGQAARFCANGYEQSRVRAENTRLVKPSFDGRWRRSQPPKTCVELDVNLTQRR